jgi:chemotaxis protein MotB
MATMRSALRDIEGKIAVEGHTDNVPISTAGFRSNWDLSASRALSVTHELIRDEALDHERFMVIGLADTSPHKPNTSAQNRAQNRRVEIVIRQGLDSSTAASIEDVRKSNPSALDTLDLNVEDISTPALE